MRIAVIMGCFLVGGVVGLFVGGYAYEKTYPYQPGPLRGLQDSDRESGVLLGRINERLGWCVWGGGIGGLTLAIGSAVIVHSRDRKQARDSQTKQE
ncbi:MAG: hypothetical protein HZA46_24215 [Planctomycetales bacterium]|nr:hypothetical protein [Planctomycetales bacterium]